MYSRASVCCVVVYFISFYCILFGFLFFAAHFLLFFVRYALLCAFVFICLHNINFVFLCAKAGEREREVEWATAGKTETKRKAEAQDTRAEVQLVCAGKSVKNLAWNIRNTYIYKYIYLYICISVCISHTHTHTVPVNTRRCCCFTTWVDFCVILVRVLKLIWLGCAGQQHKDKDKAREERKRGASSFIMRATNRNQQSDLIKI